jgi:hypothetical protein
MVESILKGREGRRRTGRQAECRDDPRPRGRSSLDSDKVLAVLPTAETPQMGALPPALTC